MKLDGSISFQKNYCCYMQNFQIASEQFKIQHIASEGKGVAQAFCVSIFQASRSSPYPDSQKVGATHNQAWAVAEATACDRLIQRLCHPSGVV